MHKDVMTDRADDVVQTLFYSGKEGNFIITKEQVFQATSKESNGGMTTITGHSDYRLSSYDLKNGEMTGRVNMEDGIEKAFIILGCSNGKLWVYSIDPELGFHCRDPKTLNVIENEAALSSLPPFSGFSFARPEWVKIGEHYGWNAEEDKIVITDMQGFHYFFDPIKNTLSQTETEIKNYTWNSHFLNTTGYFSKEKYISLQGDMRKKLFFCNRDSNSRFTFLRGQAIIDNDPARQVLRKKDYMDSLRKLQKVINDTLDVIYRKYPNFRSDVEMFSSNSHEEWLVHYRVLDLQRATDDFGRDIKSLEKKDPRYVLDDALLSQHNGDFYIVHATDVSDTARMLLSRMEVDTAGSFTERWKLKLSEFYIDPEKADTKGAFETVFSDGDPQFRYQLFDVLDSKLIIISQLQMVCIDVNSGKIIWQKPL